ncbi:hypothetical protein SO802_004175 [Lithocarpus litseifolius]|uniref:Uncharacterized protein n=1 Tax=Lithocarpus litseifolius TaxID=425828 RepID=A0AAW2E7V2_9ROSI
MASLVVTGFLLLAVFIPVMAESRIVRASSVSQNEWGMVRSSTSRVLIQLQDPDHVNSKRAKEEATNSSTNLVNSTSYNSKPNNSSFYGVLNPSGQNPEHNYSKRAKAEATNSSATNLVNSTSYNSKPYNSSSYGVLNPSGRGPDRDNSKRAKEEATNSSATNLVNSTSYVIVVVTLLISFFD